MEEIIRHISQLILQNKYGTVDYMNLIRNI